jgi:ADP-heptose:LPS heptosyltransferase
MRIVNIIKYYFNAILKFVLHFVGFIIFKLFRDRPNCSKIDQNAHIRILYVSLAYRGDLLVNFPAISALKKFFPNSSLACWVRAFNEPLAKLSPDIDKIIVYDQFSNKPLKAILEIAKGRKHKKIIRDFKGYNIYIDDSGYAFTSLAGFLAKIPLRIGRNFQGFGFLNHYDFPYDKNGQLIEKRLKFLRPFGLKLILGNIKKPYLTINESTICETLRQYDLSGIDYFTIQPFAGWEAKNWGIDNYGQLAAQFSAFSNMLAVFIGSDLEKDPIDQAITKYDLRAVNLAGTIDLMKTSAIIAGAQIHLGTDSVGSQIAMALGKKSVTIFGPANPLKCAYLGGENRGLLKRTRCTARNDKLYCCFDGGRSCGRQMLTKSLSVPEVYQVIAYIWSGKEKRNLIEL